MKRYFTLILPFLTLLPCHAFAEDVILYSYTKTAQKPAEWAIMPVIADLPDTKPDTLFSSLLRRKLPTYGTTSFDSSKKSVKIDETKCAYASIISAEIGQTFRAHGHSAPTYTCAGKTVSPAGDALAHFAAVIPLWQAMTAGHFDQPAVVQAGDEFLSVNEFTTRLKKQDKSLIKAVENEFENPNIFVKSGAMKGYIAQKFPNAEKRIARELSSNNTGNVNAAMAALANTKDASIAAQIKEILLKKNAQQEAYALSMIDSSNATLRDIALVILLSSTTDSSFSKAFSAVESTKNASLIVNHLSEILAESKPAHAEKISAFLIAQGKDAEIQQLLTDAAANEVSQTVAQTALKLSKSPSLKLAALSLQLQHPSIDTAFDAFDALSNADSNAVHWKRGMLSPHSSIVTASFERLDDLKALEPESTKGAAMLEKSQSAPLDAITELTADAYNSDVKVRRDIAWATRHFDNAADSLRMILLKDSDEIVVSRMIGQLVRRPADEIQLQLIKEMIARAERAPSIKCALLHAMPRLMNEKTTQAISTYASNEMFDSDISVKIASIRALSEIAQRTQDPVIAENAVTSLALTAQDKSASIVHHTKRALERTNLPSAHEILDRF